MFDPYRRWLSIPEEFRPPSHYQLLGVDPREQDREVIEAAVIRQSAYIRNFQKGPNADSATQILNEIAAAKLCLLDPAKRAAYDATLKPIASAPTAAVPVAVPVTAKPPQATTAKAASNSAASPRPRPKAAGRPDDRLEMAVRAVSADPLGPAVRKRPSPPLKFIIGGAGTALGLVLLIVLTSGRSTPDSPPIVAGASESKKAAEAPPVIAESAENKNHAEALDSAPKSESPMTSASAKRSDVPIPPEAVTPPAAPAVVAPKESPVTAGSAPVVDLLRSIRLPENAVVGDWKLNNGELLSPNLDSSARLQIPYVPPSDYRLTVSGMRAGGQGDLVLGLVMAGRQFTVALDAGVADQIFCGIGLIDGKKSDENGTRRYISNVLGDNQPYTVVCEVHPGSVDVKVNGRALMNWSGDPARLSLLEGSRVPRTDELFMLAYQASHHIRQIELEVLPLGATPGAMAERDVASSEMRLSAAANPPDAAGAKGIGLLGWVDLDKMRITGGWQFDKLGLTHVGSEYARIAIPLAPQGSYQLHASFIRQDDTAHVTNGRELVFLLPVAGRRHVGLICCKDASGLDMISGKRWYDKENGTQINYSVMAEGVPHRIDCAVEVDSAAGRCSITAELDGKQIVAWKGAVDDLGVVAHWAAEPSTLGLGVREAARINYVRLEADPSTIKVLDGERLVDYRADLQSKVAPRDGVKFGLTAEYFSDRDAKFARSLRTQVDPTIDFHWGNQAPRNFERPEDFFTVRWTGTLTPPPLPGEWTLVASAGDFMRIWLDNKKIFDHWGTEAKPFNDERIAQKVVGAGPHALKVEYAEMGGVAFAQLRWIAPGETTEKPIPPWALKPDAPDGGGESDSLFLSALEPKETQIMPGGTLNQIVSLNGVKSPHGIFAHPDGRKGSRVVYMLPQAYRSISGKVAINDTSPGSESPLTFKILVAGRTIWRSKPIQAKGEFQDFDVKLPAAKKIELVVDCPGGARHAHSVWIEPQVTGPIKSR